MKKLIIALIGCIVLFGGCSEDVLDLNNPSQYDESSYYKTQKECQEAVAACYSVLTQRPFYARDWFFMFDLMTGQAIRSTNLEVDLVQFDMFSYKPENIYVGWAWHGFYRMSMRALLAIEKVSAWETKSEAQAAAKERFLGEAYFFHGYAYYFLTEMWGDVPYHESWESIKNDPSKARVPYAEVQTKAEEALLTALSKLPEAWESGFLGRVTKDATRAMLGKLYLTQGQNDKALQQFQSIQANTFHNDYYKLFSQGNQTSKEIIMQVLHKFWSGNAYYMWGGKESTKATNTGRHLEYGWNDWNNVSIPNEATEKFKYTLNGAPYLDPRNQLIIYGDGEMGDDDFAAGKVRYLPFSDGDAQTGFKWKKYCYYEDYEHMIIDDGNHSSILIRVTDIKLLMAEAYIAKGEYGQALNLINEVRTREAVKAEPYAEMNAGNAFEILKRERYIELFGEQHYWFDLVRWDRLGKANLLDELKGKNITAQHKKFPIPTQEKDTNPNMDVKDSWN
jgi:SusD family.